MPEEDWSAVPSDLLELISKRLLSWDDYVRFRSVCTSWRSAAPKRPHLPLFVVMNPRFPISPFFELCNFPDAELYIPQHMREPEQIPPHRNCGCSRGWVCSTTSRNRRSTIYLHNPFTGAQIRLPILPHEAVPLKVVLSSDPTLDPHNCVVMAECCNRLMLYIRLEDASWTPAMEDFPDSTRDDIADTIFYKGNSYAVSSQDRLFVCHLGSHDARFIEILPAEILFPDGPPANREVFSGILPAEILFPDSPPANREVFSGRYLVVSSGDLFMVVVVYTSDSVDKVAEFQVFQVDMDCGRLRFFRPKNLGGRAFFLSPWSMSLSLSVSTSPASHTCRENCIYFAGQGDRIVVFSMEDNKISFLTDVLWPFKFWLTPSLCY